MDAGKRRLDRVPLLLFDRNQPWCQDEWEQKAVAELRRRVRPENEQFSAALPLVCKVVRGWCCEGFAFARAADRVERAAVVFNMGCDWRREIAAAGIDFAHDLSTEKEFRTVCPVNFPGMSRDGHLIIYATIPGDLEQALGIERSRLHLFQSLFRMEQTIEWHRATRTLKGLQTRPTCIAVCDVAAHGNAVMSRANVAAMQAMSTHALGFNFLEALFPASLEQGIFINASFAFRALWAIAKLFLHPTTVQLFTVCGSNYQKELAKHGIPMSSLPMASGGNALNPPCMVVKKHVTAAAPVRLKLIVPEYVVGITYKFRVAKGRGPVTVKVTLLHEGMPTIVYSAQVTAEEQQGEFTLPPVSSERECTVTVDLAASSKAAVCYLLDAVTPASEEPHSGVNPGSVSGQRKAAAPPAVGTVRRGSATCTPPPGTTASSTHATLAHAREHGWFVDSNGRPLGTLL